MTSARAITLNGHVTINEYYVNQGIYDAKVLNGNTKQHVLPDYAHRYNSKYIREIQIFIINTRNTWRHMVYD